MIQTPTDRAVSMEAKDAANAIEGEYIFGRQEAQRVHDRSVIIQTAIDRAREADLKRIANLEAEVSSLREVKDLALADFDRAMKQLREAQGRVKELEADGRRLAKLDSLLTDEHGFEFTVRWDNDQDTVAIVDGLGKVIAPATSADFEEQDPGGTVFRAAIDAALAGRTQEGTP